MLSTFTMTSRCTKKQKSRKKYIHQRNGHRLRLMHIAIDIELISIFFRIAISPVSSNEQFKVFTIYSGSDVFNTSDTLISSAILGFRGEEVSGQMFLAKT